MGSLVSGGGRKDRYFRDLLAAAIFLTLLSGGGGGRGCVAFGILRYCNHGPIVFLLTEAVVMPRLAKLIIKNKYMYHAHSLPRAFRIKIKEKYDKLLCKLLKRQKSTP